MDLVKQVEPHPMPGRKVGRAETAVIRDKIDRGEGGDKVNACDPAAAPLGTDDEAADRPASLARTREVLSDLQRTENRHGSDLNASRFSVMHETDQANRTRRSFGFVVWCAAAVVIAAVLVAGIVLAR